MGFWNVEGSNAYAVVSATLTVSPQGPKAARNRHARIYVFKAAARNGRSTPKRGGRTLVTAKLHLHDPGLSRERSGHSLSDRPEQTAHAGGPCIRHCPLGPDGARHRLGIAHI